MSRTAGRPSRSAARPSRRVPLDLAYELERTLVGALARARARDLARDLANASNLARDLDLRQPGHQASRTLTPTLPRSWSAREVN
jgi:hypothetical protein